jgi:hypothetical protein
MTDEETADEFARLGAKHYLSLLEVVERGVNGGTATNLAAMFAAVHLAALLMREWMEAASLTVPDTEQVAGMMRMLGNELSRGAAGSQEQK